MSSHPKLTPEILETLRRHCGKGADLDAVQALLWATWSPGMEQEPHSQTTEGPASPRDSMESPLPSRGRNSRQLLEALPWPSFILKGDTILETNEDGLRLLNAASQTSLPRSLTDTLGPGSAKSDMPPGQWVQYKLLGGDNQTSSVRGQTIPIDDQHTLLILEDQAYLDHLKSSLRETLSLFKSVINTSLNGIMAFDSVRDETGALIDFRWTVVNDAALGMVPFDRETLLGSRLLELMPGNKESGLFDAYARVVETGETFEIEQHYDHEEEGISAWFKITAVKTGDGFAVTFADITPMRQTLEDLNRQKELLDLFISHAPAAVAMFDKEMRYLMASQRWLLDYGLEGQDITGCSHFDVFPELGDHWREIYKACLDGATEYSEEEAVPRLDGKTDWIRWEIHPWYTNTNRQGGIIMFSEVITERKRYQEKIRQSERRLRAFIDAVPAGLLAIDQSGLPQYANQAAMSLLDRPYLLDDPVPFPFRHSLERSSGMMYPLRKLPLYLALEGQTTTVNDLDILHHKERIPIEISASPIRDQDGQIDFAVAVFSDISERLRIDKIKSEFISTVSHELRTPLTAIQGSLGLILGTADGSLSPMAEEMLSIAHRNSERLVLLINDILDMEKIQSGSIEFDFQPLLLDHEVLNGIQDIAGMSLALGIPIELTTPPTGLTVHADSPRLQQVLANLLSNALKFSAPNSVVEVEVKGEGTDVRISILDRGKGINPEFESRLFERFAQGDSSDSRRKGGTGLGLSISKAIVDRMRGSIAYAPRPGGGSVFTVTLPSLIPKMDARNTSTLSLREGSGLFSAPDTGGANSPSTAGHPEHAPIHETSQVVVVIDTNEARAAQMASTLRGAGFDTRLYDSPEALPEEGIGPRVDIVALQVDYLEALEKRRLISNSIKQGELIPPATPAAVEGRYTFLYVEDDESLQTMLKGHLNALGETHVAADLESARTQITTRQFDLVILDRRLPDGDGLELLPLLNTEDAGNPPIVVWSAYETPSTAIDLVTAAMVKSRSTASSLMEVIRNLLETGRVGTPG